VVVLMLEEIASGWHDLVIEWAVGAEGDTAYVGDRTVVVSCYPANPSFAQHFVAAPPGPAVATNSNISAISLVNIQSYEKFTFATQTTQLPIEDVAIFGPTITSPCQQSPARSKE